MGRLSPKRFLKGKSNEQQEETPVHQLIKEPHWFQCEGILALPERKWDDRNRHPNEVRRDDV